VTDPTRYVGELLLIDLTLDGGKGRHISSGWNISIASQRSTHIIHINTSRKGVVVDVDGVCIPVDVALVSQVLIQLNQVCHFVRTTTQQINTSRTTTTTTTTGTGTAG
jgi:hypothetical protein